MYFVCLRHSALSLYLSLSLWELELWELELWELELWELELWELPELQLTQGARATREKST